MKRISCRGRAVFAVLACHTMLVMFPFLACAAVLTDVMADLSMSAGTSAFTLSIITIVAGVCMFFSGFVCDKLGYLNAVYAAVLCDALGTLLTAVAANVPMFMLGRGLLAVGFGMNMSALNAMASMWFPGGQYAIFNTTQTILASVGSALAYILIFPLSSAFGGWRGAYLFFAAMLGVYFVVCLLVVRYPEGVEEGLDAQKAAIKSGQLPKPEFPLGRVLKRRNFLLIAFITLLMNTSSTLMQTYMPTYLTVELGMDAIAANSISSVGMFAGMFGSLVGGILVAKTGRRKIWQIISTVVFIITGILVLRSTLLPVLLISYALFNIGYYLRQPATGQYMVEEIQPYDPAIMPAAVAVTSGLPMLLGMVTSFIASAMIERGFSYGMTMLIFVLICIAALAANFLLSEVGPNAKTVASKKA